MIRAFLTGVELAALVAGQVGADLDFQDMQVVATADWDPKNRAFEDSFTVEDAVALGVSKVLADSFTIADARPVFDVGKALADSFTVTDSFGRTVQYHREVAESVTITDALSMSIIRGGAIGEAPISGHP